MQMVLRRSVLRYMSRADLRLRWMVGLRNVVVLLALVGLASIWMDELRAFATAVVAFAVAFVIWLKRAFADLGLQEFPGAAARPRIVEMYAKAGHPEIKSDEVAWCSAAVNAWMVESNVRGTASLAARSWLAWGRAIDIRKTIPRGAVLIFRRGNSSWQGMCASASRIVMAL
jgi:hypothetical protein